MSIYIGFYGIITILYIFLTKYAFRIFKSDNKDLNKTVLINRQKRTFLIVAAGMLVLIIGFRSEYQGVDLYNSLGTGYFYVYDIICKDSVSDIFRYFNKLRYANFEIGFVLFCKLLGTLCSHHQILLLGCAFLSVVPIVHFIYKYSSNVWLSLVSYLALPFFTTTLFSGIRQGIAVGFVVWSWGFLKKKKLLPFVITVLLACTFHSTAIVTLVCYPVYHIRLDKKSALYGGCGLLLIVYLLQEPLFWVLARLVHNAPRLYKTNSVNLFLLLSGIYALCVMVSRKEDYEIRGYINIFWLACGTQAFSRVHMLANRLAWYFIPVLIVLVPSLLESNNIKEKPILKRLIPLIGGLLILLGLYYLKNNTMAMAYPYIPFWK